MDRQARNVYLETEINTATPQKLRLMLIEGALRSARQTLVHWKDNRSDDARESCRRCRNMLLELFTTTKTQTSNVAEKTADLYIYLIQAITQADAEGDTSQIDDLIRILEIEQGTWREVCQRFPNTIASQSNTTTELDARGFKAIPPPDLPHRRIGDSARGKPSNPYTPNSETPPGIRLEG